VGFCEGNPLSPWDLGGVGEKPRELVFGTQKRPPQAGPRGIQQPGEACRWLSGCLISSELDFPPRFSVSHFKVLVQDRSRGLKEAFVVLKSKSSNKTGTLFLVGTPIGNLEDITLRALRVLAQVDLVASEDTRRTRKLLSAHSIRASLMSYHEQGNVWRQKAARLVEMLLEGKDLALVSEAGTPGLSDPGYGLVSLCLEKNIPIRVVPGPSAVVAAVVASGLPAQRFAFEGFLPKKKEDRLRMLESLRWESRTLVFFEAPARLSSTLQDMERLWGDRKGAVVREITKVFEEVRRGSLKELLEWAKEAQIRGEITLVVEGCGKKIVPSDLLGERIKFLLERCSLEPKCALRVLKEETGLPRKILYQAILGKKQRKQEMVDPE